MNIHWSHNRGEYFRSFSARDEFNNELFSVCERCENDVREYIGKLTRWCVFDRNKYGGYCGDIPLGLTDDEVKATALVLWRLREEK